MGTYLAGLWSNFLQADLFWSVSRDPGLHDGTNNDFLAEVLSIHCSLAGSDELGMITSADLVLRAKTIPVCLTQQFFSDGKYWTITLESQDPATGKQANLGPYWHDCVQPTPEADFVPGFIPKATSPDSRPEKLVPVNDAEYLAMLAGSRALIIVKVVEAGEPLVCERVGTVHRDSGGDFNDKTRWFDGAKPRALKII
ncbi:hypothetical protein Neosp_010055 [[Neocosmospora] mangrovei]